MGNKHKSKISWINYTISTRNVSFYSLEYLIPIITGNIFNMVFRKPIELLKVISMKIK